VPFSGCSVNGYWLLLYSWPLIITLLVAIHGYFINGYWWLFY
jgi:hypothetical protein